MNSIETLQDLVENEKVCQLIRETADKLQFSNFIGKRWEEMVCIPTLRELAANPVQARFHLNLPENHEIGDIVALDADPQIKREADRLKIPDILIVEVDSTDPTHVTLRACDFKFNLQMAVYRQVSPRTLSELLVQSPNARARIEASIEGLKKAGKLRGDFRLAEKTIEDNTQTDYLPLDEAGIIRGVTGRFISPDTEDNQAYFSSGGTIRRENVLIKQLNPSEIDNLIKGAPGQEINCEFGDLSTKTMTLIDRIMLRARILATMKAMGITDAAGLIRFINNPQEFPVPEAQRPDISVSPATKIALGKILRQNLPVLITTLQETIGLDKKERLTLVTSKIKSLKLSPQDEVAVIEYCQANL